MILLEKKIRIMLPHMFLNTNMSPKIEIICLIIFQLHTLSYNNTAKKANKTHPKLIGEKKISGEIWILIVSIIVALGCNHWIASILGSLNYRSCVCCLWIPYRVKIYWNLKATLSTYSNQILLREKVGYDKATFSSNLMKGKYMYTLLRGKHIYEVINPSISQNILSCTMV